MSKGLLDKQLWALTPDAKRTVEEMVKEGLDRDIAVSVLEKLLGDDIYDFGDEE